MDASARPLVRTSFLVALIAAMLVALLAFGVYTLKVRADRTNGGALTKTQRYAIEHADCSELAVLLRGYADLVESDARAISGAAATSKRIARLNCP